MKKIIISFICVAMLALNGCSVANSDNSNPTEASTAKAEIGTSEYNILEEYSSYFNDNKVSTENITLTKEVADKYSESFIERGSKSMLSQTIENVKEQFGLDYLRHSAEVTTGFDYVYSIHPAKDSDNSIWYLVFVYNKNGYVIDSFCVNEILRSWEFSDQLEIGKSTYDDVLKIDKNAIIYDGNDGVKESKHKCSDSVNVYIIYSKANDTYVVSDIEYSTDPVRFTDNIKQVDYELFFKN